MHERAQQQEKHSKAQPARGLSLCLEALTMHAAKEPAGVARGHDMLGAAGDRLGA